MNEMSDTRQGDVRPVPDPTVLTTAASLRLEETLRRLVQSEIEHMEMLMNERFAHIETQFKMLDARTAEQKKDTKDALDAALAAQKEAVASQTASSEKSITKSETATIERIKAVETLLSASTRASDDKIDDLKSRIVAIEAVKLGTKESVSDSRATIAAVVGVIGVVIAFAAVLFAVFKP